MRIDRFVDVLINDVDRIVKDASNKVGDIEFRLTELEGGDTSVKPAPEPLGGGITRPKTPNVLASTEQSDFDAAVKAADEGDNAKAATLFATFLQTYPGGPLSTEAQYRRGEALAARQDWRGAARSFLDAFSGGQSSEACLTLTEVDSRYPGSEVAGDVAAQRQALACP